MRTPCFCLQTACVILLNLMVCGSVDAFPLQEGRGRSPTMQTGCLHLSSNSPEVSKQSKDLGSEIFSQIAFGFRFHSSIKEIPPEEWNSCLTCNQTNSAFLDHSWLICLEQSGCASPETGWVPQHLSIQQNGETLGYVPLYIKGHSLGEFIFDNAWAEAAYQNGIQYYPKMLSAVPFTPVSGNRILWRPSVYEMFVEDEVAQLRRSVALFLRKTALSNKISSVHINFMTEQEATDIAGELKLQSDQDKSIREKVKHMLGRRLGSKDDYLRRTSVQYHWRNKNPNNNGLPYTSFDDYLGCFKSKRRINIRRERRTVSEDAGISVDAIRGRDILKYPGLMEKMFEIYRSTFDKMYYGRQYLTSEFFQMLARSDFVDNLCFMCARRYKTSVKEFRAEDVFAGTFNVVKDGVFYGRYWGCLGDKEIKNLHFETCYWAAIEYCIDNELVRMEPGAGGGDYKWARGFDAALIHSVHYISRPGLRRAISEYVDYETEYNVKATDYLLLRRKGKMQQVKEKV